MALVRILVDGFSLLHNWPALARGQPRHAAAARDELVWVLTQYADVCGTPITVIFDGGGAPPGTPKAHPSGAVEILYSRAGRTADDLIERLTYRLQPFGEVLVVTDDFAERDTVLAFGAMTSSCRGFVQTLEGTLGELAHELRAHNRREQTRFKQGCGL